MLVNGKHENQGYEVTPIKRMKEEQGGGYQPIDTYRHCGTGTNQVEGRIGFYEDITNEKGYQQTEQLVPFLIGKSP